MSRDREGGCDMAVFEKNIPEKVAGVMLFLTRGLAGLTNDQGTSVAKAMSKM